MAEEPNVTIETEITDAALSEYGGAVKAALIIFLFQCSRKLYFLDYYLSCTEGIRGQGQPQLLADS